MDGDTDGRVQSIKLVEWYTVVTIVTVNRQITDFKEFSINNRGSWGGVLEYESDLLVPSSTSGHGGSFSDKLQKWGLFQWQFFF